MDMIDESGHKVILAGFGGLGTDIGRFLLSAGVKPVILDHDASNVNILRHFGFEVYYGDVTRLDLLESAGASEAEVLVISIPDVNVSKKLIEMVRKHFPNLKIVASATNMSGSYSLMDLNVDYVRRTTLGTAMTIGQDVLKELGMDPYKAYRLMRIFKKHDDEMLSALYKQHREAEDGYVSMYQKQMKDLESLMAFDQNYDGEDVEKAWTVKNPEL